MVIGALAIWQAGGAYLPMDPTNPPARLAAILLNAQAQLVLGRPLTDPAATATRCQFIDPGMAEITVPPEEPPPCDVTPDDLAYVIYTSGSTGSPKGVEIDHGSLTNLAAWHQQAFAVTARDRASHLAGLGFDAAVWELWPYLAAGASVDLTDDETRRSPELLRDWLVARRITIGFAPTPLAERLLALSWPPQTALRILLTGGDTLRHYPPPGLPFALVNNYGPTEATVVATSGRVIPEAQTSEPPPIGSAITGNFVYILDDRLQPVPPGEPGEICIGGAGLARGYRNLPELTAEKFIAIGRDDHSVARIYRTGDIGRLLPDGQIAYLGRLDDQVKIQGFRIEPDEIVGRLNQHPEVAESLVIARTNARMEKYLAAYVVAQPGCRPSESGLPDFLRATLPAYMVPATFVYLDAFPVTPNGKIDRALLAEMAPPAPCCDEDDAAPQTTVEGTVASIVSSLLQLSKIGRDDNFFLQGGHSLFGAQLIARIKGVFGVELSLLTVFDSPTVAALAAEIERRTAAPAELCRVGSLS
jgi:amino acid adenylation domain-containing protein